MNEKLIEHAGEIAAITLVVRQLLARLPQEEQDEIRAFAESRLRAANATGDDPIKAVLAAAGRELEALFTAATPEKP